MCLISVRWENCAELMNGLRNRVVHDYEGVNLRLVWEIISGEKPDLRDSLKELL